MTAICAACITISESFGATLLMTEAANSGSSTPMGRIVWDFDQNASGRGFFLNITGDQETRLLSFQAHGKNNSSDPISEFSGFIRSRLTNAPRQIYIFAQDADESKTLACSLKVPTLPQDTFGIPPFADFDVTTFEKTFTAFGIDGMPPCLKRRKSLSGAKLLYDYYFSNSRGSRGAP
jgi:hypothetical protein